MAERDFIPAAGFSALTRFYDRSIELFSGERLLRGGIVEAITAQVGHMESPRVLEVGCGTGSLALKLASELPQAQVVGVDIDQKALAIAKSKRGAQAVEWREGSATELPVAAGSFDVVALSLVMHHLMPEQQPLALRQALAALVPGGSLHLVDFGRPRGRLARTGSTVLARIDGVKNTRPIFSGELPGMIEAAGFSDPTLEQQFDTPAGTIERHVARRPL